MGSSNSSITDLTLSKEKQSAVLKFSMENRTTELRLIMGDPDEIKVIVTQNTLSELKVDPKTTAASNASPGAYDMGDVDLELRKIINENLWYSMGGIVNWGDIDGYIRCSRNRAFIRGCNR